MIVARTNGSQADPEKKAERPPLVFRITWSWTVEDDPLTYVRLLGRSWLGKRLPLRGLSSSACVDGQVQVVAEVEARDASAAAREWLEFPLKAIHERGLAPPESLFVLVARLLG